MYEGGKGESEKHLPNCEAWEWQHHAVGGILLGKTLAHLDPNIVPLSKHLSVFSNETLPLQDVATPLIV